MTEPKNVRLSTNPLAMSVTSLAGVGDKISEALLKNNINTVFDLLLHTPKSMVAQDQAPGFLHMETGRTYVAVGKVFSTKLSGIGQKRRLEVILRDDTGRMTAIFFGPAVTYAQQIMQKDREVCVIGQVKEFLGRMQMVHPKIITNANQVIDDKVANYSQLGGLNSALFKRIVDRALSLVLAHSDEDHLAKEWLALHRLHPLKLALKKAHSDSENGWDERARSPVFRRLALEELISFYMRLNRERDNDKNKNGAIIPAQSIEDLVENFLPFSLTCAQERVCNEIIADLAKPPQAMCRLVQGDVGSGKTAVSAIAARHVAKAGLQVAVMAPTEILSEQLFKVYQSFFKNDESMRIALLTAHTKAKDRLILVEKLASNEISILVGTHALLSDDVSFFKLGLLIIDEQHRFGVKQRAEILKGCHIKQGFCPHLLVMSATPIPRSLALTFYGDLDLSVIDERPKGRLPIHTQILMGDVLKNIGRCCKRIIDTNQKAFVVFPLVEESEHLDLENATKAVSLLKQLFGENQAMLLHGKMKPAEKIEAMEAFRDNKVSFLVATTVVEVGIDIPDATCMVIAHPERFGLAQLHQLRGRVGRKDLKSYCLLVTDVTNKFSHAYKRLSAMCNTDNGFKLAEIDLKIRGPGELLGTKQSGLQNFVIFNYTDFADLVNEAKNIASNIHKQGAKNEHRHLLENDSAHFS